MTGDHPRDEHDGPAPEVGDGAADDDAAADASSGPSAIDPPVSGPALHRPRLWLALFLIVVALTVLVTIVGFVADDRSSSGATVPAATGALTP